MKIITSLSCIVLLLIGCKGEEITDIPEEIEQLENLIIIQKTADVPEFELTRQETYADGEDLITGVLLGVEADNNGHVFLTDFTQKQIHVFDPNGNFISSLGGEGLGPGEFQGFSYMHIEGDSLHVFDRMQFKINTFELNSFTFVDATTVRQYPRRSEGYDEIRGWIPMYVTPRYDGTSLAGFVDHPRDSRIDRDTYNIGKVRMVKYYLMDYEGNLISDKLFELRTHEDIVVTVGGEHYYNSTEQPYLGRPLITDIPKNEFITNWTKDFLLKIYHKDGSYDRAMYYPGYEKRVLNREELLLTIGEGGRDRQVVEHAELPEFWPAIYAIETDEEDRVWIAVITKGDNLLQWWVINKQGEWIAKANMPKELGLEWLISRPPLVIKNESMYTWVKNPENGARRFVRYKMDIE